MSAWELLRLFWPVIVWILLLFVMGIMLCKLGWWLEDRYEWNGGVCRKNGLPWRRTPYEINSREYQAGDLFCHMRSPVDKSEVILELIVVKDERPC